MTIVQRNIMIDVTRLQTVFSILKTPLGKKSYNCFICEIDMEINSTI
jgi:hypothetical protein